MDLSNVPTERNWRAVETVPQRRQALGPLKARVEVDTSHGTVTAEPGDYLVHDDEGDVWPVSGEKFLDTYRLLPDDD